MGFKSFIKKYTKLDLNKVNIFKKNKQSNLENKVSKQEISTEDKYSEKLKFNKTYRKTIKLYNNRRKLTTIVKSFNDSTKDNQFLENMVTNYIDRGIRKNVAYRNRFNSEIANKLGLKNKIENLISQGESYKNIQSYVNTKGMNISYSTIYRIKKSLA